MDEPFEIEANISAGKKFFKVVSENDGYTLLESGSIAAVIKQKDGRWEFTTGSYAQSDADLIGGLIQKSQNR